MSRINANLEALKKPSIPATRLVAGITVFFGWNLLLLIIQCNPLRFSLGLNPGLITAAKSAFKSTYVDPNNNIPALIKCIKQCQTRWSQPKAEIYAPYIAVVQGSMMGKSRLFYTLPTHQVFVFYICLGESGVPECFPNLMRRLTADTCTEGFYSAFLLTALAALEKFKSENDGSSQDWFDLQSSAQFWTPILGAITASAFILIS